MTPEDWTRLYDAHCKELYASVSHRVGGDAELAEDLVQEAWLAALDAWPPPAKKPVAWLLTCAMNRLRNHIKRHRPRAIEQDPLDPEDLRGIDNNPERAELLQAGLARLSPEQADLIEGHHFDGLALSELAAQKGVSVRAIEGRLARARKALRSALNTIASSN